MSTEENKTYEMLWNCKFCGQRKNLGLSHRCCPGCGAPQDPAARYFPSDAEKVAVEDHPYAGADVVCPACKQANSRNSKCCSSCGSPVAGGVAVKMRDDHVGQAFGAETAQDARRDQAPQAAAAPVPPKALSPIGCIVAVAVVALIALVLFLVFRKREGAFVISEKSWDRTVEVQQRAMVRQSAWCDAMPAGAIIVTRTREKRSTQQVADGETCVTRKKDQGNGTFKETRECTPKMKTEDVLSDKCGYDAEGWKIDRTAKAHGSDKEAPAWPAVKLSRPNCQAPGCEREGTRSETYNVTVSEASGGAKSNCVVPLATWSALRVGDGAVGKIGAVTKTIDCATLAAK